MVRAIMIEGETEDGRKVEVSTSCFENYFTNVLKLLSRRMLVFKAAAKEKEEREEREGDE